MNEPESRTITRDDDVTDVFPMDRHGSTFIPAGWREELTDEEKTFEEFVEEMGGDLREAKITVYRIPLNDDGRPTTRKWAYCFDCGISDYSFSQLLSVAQRKHGGGQYKIVIRDAGGIIRKNKTVNVENPKDGDGKPLPSDPGNVIDAVSRAMREQSERFEYMMMQARGPSFDIEKIATVFASLAAAAASLGISFKRDKEPSAIDKLTEAATVKTLLKELSGDDGEISDPFWQGVFKSLQSVGGPLMAAVTQAQESGRMDRDGRLLENPVPRQIAREKVQVTNEQREMILSFKPYLVMLVNQCKGGNSPQDAARFVTDALESGGLDAIEQVIEFLRIPRIVDVCAEVAGIAEIRENRDWFIEWRGAVLAELEAIRDEPDDGDLTSDDADDENSHDPDDDAPGTAIPDASETRTEPTDRDAGGDP